MQQTLKRKAAIVWGEGREGISVQGNANSALEYFTAWQIEIRGESIDNSLTAKHYPETATHSWINTESD